MGSEGYHEPIELLSGEVIDRHRAISTIMEELEAVDWYDQRITATSDESLAAVMAHHRDEEKEHAAMTIEWLRRNDPVFDEQLRTYLFTDDPITEVEAIAEGRATEPALPDATAGVPEPASDTTHHGLGIGSLQARAHEEDPQ
jgi:ferritin-like protein